MKAEHPAEFCVACQNGTCVQQTGRKVKAAAGYDQNGEEGQDNDSGFNGKENQAYLRKILIFTFGESNVSEQLFKRFYTKFNKNYLQTLYEPNKGVITNEKFLDYGRKIAMSF